MRKRNTSYTIIPVTGIVPIKQQTIQKADGREELSGMPDVETVNDKNKWYKKLYEFNKKSAVSD